MREDELREIYFEVIDLFRACGGAYLVLPPSTCSNILDALDNGRYVLARENGKLVRALFFWRFFPEDLETVKQGKPPQDRNTGPIFYICEHAGKDGMRGIIKAARELKDRYGGASVCWHDRYLNGTFRFYRRKP